MRKNTIISKLAALYAKTGKIPGWKAVEAIGIMEEDIYRHWEWLTDAVLEAEPAARRAKDLKDRKQEEEADEREEDDPTGRHHYSVYVVNLSSAIGKLAWFAAENSKGPKGTKACLYVGATWHTPEERLANHKRGHKPARRVRPYMIKIDKDLTKEHRGQYATRDEAERVEKRLAITLRKQGYRVWQR